VPITLVRTHIGDQGTFGRLHVPNFTHTIYTGELPWHDNTPNVSSIPNAQWNLDHGYCLPEGYYRCQMRLSPKMGWTYWLTNVPCRSFCLIHPANYMGDEAKGYHTQLRGCIALGYALGVMDGQMAVLRSRVAVIAFMGFMQRKPFTLHITNGKG
jgi:hypothetical protein